MNGGDALSGDPLAGLRDIQLPPPVGFWPPAPGWWIAALLLIALLIIAALWWRRRYRRNAYRRAALAELRQLDAGANATAINVLLKRTARAAGFGDAAALSGEAWLQFLERTRGRGPALFGARERELLLALYSPEPPDATPLRRIARRWIRSHRC